MPTPEGGKQFEPGIIERVAAALRYVGTGKAPAWFGPNEPLSPQAPDDVKGRPYDFAVGFNLNITPGTEGVSDGIADFVTLRRISDPTQGGVDLLRGAIETRKDQLEGQKWVVRGRNGKDGGPRAKAVMDALRQPDMVNTFRQWARPFWDDLLVLDAPTIYFRPVANIKGQRFIPEVIDGATIKLLVDKNGRTPLPPDPAFQQVIKGLPAVDYTVQELLYMPRNRRSYRFYGMSPVEQVLGIASISLKRQLHLLNYYTDGNVPDAVVTAPPEWNPDQVKMAQNWLDTLTDTAVRRKIRVLPGGNFQQTKPPELKSELDEWLARIICWVFSLSPGTLVKDQTKATAGTNAQTAKEEGLEPWKLWWKDAMDVVIQRCFEGVEDLEFAYQDEEISDANVKMTVWTGYKQAGIVTVDEVRDKALGLEPMTDDQKAEVAPPPPPVMTLGAPRKPGVPGKPGTPQGEAGGSASSLPPAPSEKGALSGDLEKKKPSLRY